ncbi:MAG: hypothetical protein NC548_36265 [Lachnospiraceae bacterium]|nr:hypothetical protein [Lachnospiraceae bacterium]MCM1373306.1 hypothetical protein [Bacteroides sp.]
MVEERKFTGYGTCLFSNGEYTGEIVDGIRQGYGVMNFSNYDSYDGDWDSGKMHGKGTYKFWDKKKDRFATVYTGQFNHGVREGAGRMEYANHDVYQGTWQNDHRTGDGICWFADGSVFHGIWKFDKMIRGVLRKADGQIYDGELKNGQFNGYGKLFWPSGNWFEGIFAENKPFKGMMFSPDGKISEFKEGVQL